MLSHGLRSKNSQFEFFELSLSFAQERGKLRCCESTAANGAAAEDDPKLAARWRSDCTSRLTLGFAAERVTQRCKWIKTNDTICIELDFINLS